MCFLCFFLDYPSLLLVWSSSGLFLFCVIIDFYMPVCFLTRNKKIACEFRWLVSWGESGRRWERETVSRTRWGKNIFNKINKITDTKKWQKLNDIRCEGSMLCVMDTMLGFLSLFLFLPLSNSPSLFLSPQTVTQSNNSKIIKKTQFYILKKTYSNKYKSGRNLPPNV